MAHLQLHLLPLLLVIHQRPAVGKVAALDLPLRFAEQAGQMIERTGRGAAELGLAAPIFPGPARPAEYRRRGPETGGRCPDRPAGRSGPINWRSMRAESCISVRITCRPPSSATPVAELDVGAAAGHVRRDGDVAPLAPPAAMISRFGGDLLGVEHLCSMPGLGEQPRKDFRFVDRAGADQHRPAGGVDLRDFSHDRLHLGLRRAEDLVRQSLRGPAADSSESARRAAIDALQFARRVRWPCRSCPPDADSGGNNPGSVTRAAWPVSTVTSTPSLASIAWCRPSRHLRPSAMRPVNSSTMTISPSRTT